jgi:hypothetical protein
VDSFVGKAIDEAAGLVRGIVRFVQRHLHGQLRYGSTVLIRAWDGCVLRLIPGDDIQGSSDIDPDDENRFVVVKPGSDFAASRLRERLRYGDTIALRPVKRLKFLGVNFDNDHRLSCWGPQVYEWETFTIGRGEAPTNARKAQKGPWVNFGDYISLSVRRDGEAWTLQYLNEGDKGVAANVHHVHGWETFVFLLPGAV